MAMTVQQAIDKARALMPWLPAPLATVYAMSWIDTADQDLALAAMRADNRYNQYFAGNRREDGSFRYDEATYSAVKESFRSSLMTVGVNPDLFQNQFVNLLTNEVSPAEFTRRIDVVASRVLAQSEQMKQYYADRFGIQLTNAALVASVLDPSINDAVLERRLTTAEIGAEAALKGYGLDFDMADRLYDSGVDRGQANQLFGQAAGTIPEVNALVARHNDPDDSFDLNEFLSAAVFGDSLQRRRLRQALSNESASFAGQGSIAQNQAGGLAGLDSR